MAGKTILRTLVMFLAWGAADVGLPCGGTPRPNCGRAIWLAMLAQRNLVWAPQGQVPIQFAALPNLVYNPNAPCAQPLANAGVHHRQNGAAVPQPQSSAINGNLTVEGVAQQGNMLVNIPAFSWPLASPTAPGLQPAANQAVLLPDAGFDRNEPVVVDLTGTLSYTFENGTGSGTVSTTDQVRVYVVPAAPDAPNTPLLDISYFQPFPSDSLFQRCRRGDQAYMYFRVVNNDPANTVTLNVDTQLGSLSGLPAEAAADPGNAFNNNFFAIMDTEGDLFAHRFATNPADWSLLPPGDPHTNPATMSQTITVAPGESEIVVVSMRSFGMCSNNSCNKLAVSFSGTFADGRQALGCATTALVVSDAPAKSPLCEIADSLKSGPSSGAFWTAAQFFDPGLQAIPHAQTHAAGNFGGSSSGGATFIGGGTRLGDMITFDTSALPRGVSYNVSISSALGFGLNFVSVIGLPEGTGESKTVPVILRQPGDTLLVVVDCEKDSIRVKSANGQTLFHEGTFTGFLESPPAGLSYDPSTCREFTKTAGIGRQLCTSVFYQTVAAGSTATIQVFDDTGTPLSGTADLFGDLEGLFFTDSLFNGEITLEARDTIDVALLAMLNVRVPGTVPEQVTVPIALQPGTATMSAADINVAPTSFDFGAVTVGDSSTRLVSIENLGTADLEVTELLFSSGDTLDWFFKDRMTPTTVQPRDTFNLLLGFAPTAAGSLMTALQIVSNDPVDSLLTVVLLGLGVAPATPDISADRTNYAFGIVEVDSSKTETVTVTNRGSADLIVAPPMLFNTQSGDDTLEFSIQSGADGFTLGPGESRGVEIAYVPTRTGETGATLRFTSNDPDDSPLDRRLTGAGGVPDITAAADHNFGEVAVGMSKSVVLNIGNAGDVDLRVNLIELQGDTTDFAIADGGEPFTVAPGGLGRHAITVEYGPTSVVAGSATLRLHSNDPDQRVFEILLTGNGTATAISALNDAPLPSTHHLYQNYPNPFNPATTIRFDIPAPGKVELTVYNSGGALVATVVDAHLTAGSYAAGFAATDLPSGVYVYRLVSGRFSQTRKFTLLK